MSQIQYLQREETAPDGRPVGLVPADPGFAKSYPAVWEYLAVSSWPDGKARERSTLLLLVEDGVWKASLHDREHGRSLWRSGGTMAGALAALEEGLSEGAVDWRRARPQQGRKR